MKSVFNPANTPTRHITSLDGVWKFKFDPAKEGVAQNWAEQLPSPMLLKVPQLWQSQFPDRFSREYSGEFWYETEFFVPSDLMGQNVELRFESLMDFARIYINGLEVMEHLGSGNPFTMDVSRIILYGQYNRLSLQVSNETRCPGRWSPYSVDLTEETPRRTLDFIAEAGGGLERSVSMVSYPKTCLTNVSMKLKRLPKKGLQLEYCVEQEGNQEIRVMLVDADNRLIARETRMASSLDLSQIEKTKEETLYTFVVQICKNGRILDEYRDWIRLGNDLY